LSVGCDRALKFEVARNPKTSVEIIALLAQDSDYRVRQHVAANLGAPSIWLAKLSIDPELTVRHNVLSNPSTPVEVLVEMAEEPMVSEWASRGSRLGELDDIDWTSSSNVGNYRETLVHELINVDDSPSLARAYALVLDDCSIEDLDKCSASSSWIERCAVAQNAQTPEEITLRLATDRNKTVTEAARARLESL